MQSIRPEQHPNEPAGGSSTDVKRAHSASLTTLLDRVIVVMMVAILLTLSWPVSVVLWHQSHPAMTMAHQQARDAP
ncbi:MAG TPA: hypothetical protein VKU00_29380 [Chthonomonadaceae bacterium]|nr:hypothetical protein [Chthonomonadaceae bacterium]